MFYHRVQHAVELAPPMCWHGVATCCARRGGNVFTQVETDRLKLCVLTLTKNFLKYTSVLTEYFLELRGYSTIIPPWYHVYTGAYVEV